MEIPFLNSSDIVNTLRSSAEAELLVNDTCLGGTSAYSKAKMYKTT